MRQRDTEKEAPQEAPSPSGAKPRTALTAKYKKSPPKKCAYCGKSFTPLTKRKKFCNSKCKNKNFLTRFREEHGTSYMNDYFKAKPWKRSKDD